MTSRYQLRLSGSARRSLERELPLAVALAVWEFCSGPLSENPHRVGKPLRRELSGYFSARRGAYRVIYRVAEEEEFVHIVWIEHRANAYRPS